MGHRVSRGESCSIAKLLTSNVPVVINELQLSEPFMPAHHLISVNFLSGYRCGRPVVSKNFESPAFLPNRSIALTGSLLQSFAIKDPDAATAVFHQARFLQYAGSQRYGWPGRAQHVGQGLVRDEKIAGGGPVVAHQQPSRQAFGHIMQAITGNGL